MNDACFFLDNVSSGDFCMYVEEYPARQIPMRKIETISIPGRSGALHIDQNAFENYTAIYKCYFRGGPQQAKAIKAWLASTSRRRKLEDVYNPGTFRMAKFIGPCEIENTMNRFGRLSIEFDCNPQNYIASGLHPLKYSSGTRLNNLYHFAALPLIKVYGSGAGTLTIGKQVINIKSLNEWVMLDSETQNAYKGTINKNSSIYAPEFPTLEPGENVIAWSGGIEKIEITPRWWTL